MKLGEKIQNHEIVRNDEFKNQIFKYDFSEFHILFNLNGTLSQINMNLRNQIMAPTILNEELGLGFLR